MQEGRPKEKSSAEETFNWWILILVKSGREKAEAKINPTKQNLTAKVSGKLASSLGGGKIELTFESCAIFQALKIHAEHFVTLKVRGEGGRIFLG